MNVSNQGLHEKLELAHLTYPQLPGSQVYSILKSARQVEVATLTSLFDRSGITGRELCWALQAYHQKVGYHDLHNALFVVKHVLLSPKTGMKDRELASRLFGYFLERPEVSTLDCLEVCNFGNFDSHSQELIERRYPARLQTRLHRESNLRGLIYEKGDRSTTGFTIDDVNLEPFQNCSRLYFGTIGDRRNPSLFYLFPESKDYHELLCASTNSLLDGPGDKLPGSVGCLEFFPIESSIVVSHEQASFCFEGPIPVRRETLKKYHDYREKLFDRLAQFAFIRGITQTAMLRASPAANPDSSLRTAKAFQEFSNRLAIGTVSG